MDFISFYSILLGLAFYKLVKTVYSKKGKNKQEKRWLFEEIIHQYGGFAESLFSVSYIRSNL
jgi:hypothetical protein